MGHYKEVTARRKSKSMEQKLVEKSNALKDVSLIEIDANKDVKVDIDNID